MHSNNIVSQPADDGICACADALFVAQYTAELASSPHAIAQLGAQIERLRATWTAAAQQPDLDLLERMRTGLLIWHDLTGAYRVYAELLDTPIQQLRALLASGPAEPAAWRLLAKLLADQALMQDRLGAPQAAFVLLQEARKLARRLDDTALESRILNHRAQMCFFCGDLDSAEHLAQQAFAQPQRVHLEIQLATLLAAINGLRSDPRSARAYADHASMLATHTNDRRGSCWITLVRSWVLHDCGNYRQALDLLQAWISLVRALGDRRCELFFLLYIGQFTIELRGPHTTGLRALQRAQHLARQLGDQRGAAYATLFLAHAALSSGDLAEAARHLQHTETLWPLLHDQAGHGQTMHALGILAHWRGDHTTAAVFGHKALLTARATGRRWAQFDALLLLCHALTDLGHLEDAAVFAHQACTAAQLVQNQAQMLAAHAALAEVALAADHTAAALVHVESLLPQLAPDLLTGLIDPARVYLVCVRVLDAVGDSRAHDLLAAAQSFIRERAASLPTRQERTRLAEQIPSHRFLMQMSNTLISAQPVCAREYGA